MAAPDPLLAAVGAVWLEGLEEAPRPGSFGCSALAALVWEPGGVDDDVVGHGASAPDI